MESEAVAPDKLVKNPLHHSTPLNHARRVILKMQLEHSNISSIYIITNIV